MLTYIACTGDSGNSLKEKRNLVRYEGLKREIRKLWVMKMVYIVSIIVVTPATLNSETVFERKRR